MDRKFAKAIAGNITTIAGNVARVALIDAGQLSGMESDRAACCRAVDKPGFCNRLAPSPKL